jgi:hypothetical protein
MIDGARDINGFSSLPRPAGLPYRLARPGALVVLGLLVAAVLVAPSGFRPVPAYAAPEVAVSPTSGPPGSPFSFTGSGFTAGMTFGVYFVQLTSETHLGNVGVVADGSFSGSFQVPLDAQPGDAQIVAKNSLLTTGTTFMVTDIDDGDGDDEDDEALCRIKVTLFGVTRDDPSNQTARARILGEPGHRPECHPARFARRRIGHSR